MSISHQSLWLRAVSAGVACLLASIPAGAKDYYADKTLTMLVPNSAGGGLDLMIRSFARHFTKHIPGNPTIVVKNMPGGGGTRSLNFLYGKAKPDGLTINWGAWNAAGVVSGRKGILTGSVDTSESVAIAEKLAQGHWGVRTIENQLKVVAVNSSLGFPSGAPHPSGRNRFQPAKVAVVKGYQLNNRFLLSGVVPDWYTRNRLIHQAEEIFGPGKES